MEMVVHNAVCNNIYVTFFFVFEYQAKKELLVGRGFKNGLFVVATVEYMVKTVGLEIAKVSGHGEMIAGRD